MKTSPIVAALDSELEDPEQATTSSAAESKTSDHDFGKNFLYYLFFPMEESEEEFSLIDIIMGNKIEKIKIDFWSNPKKKYAPGFYRRVRRIIGFKGTFALSFPIARKKR